MDRKRSISILLVVFTNILGAGMIMPTLPLFAVDQFGATNFQAALFFSAYFGAQFFAAPWLGRLSDIHGRRPVLLLSQAGTVLSFIIFIFAIQIGSAIESLDLSLPIRGGLLVMYAARILDGITGGNITTARAYIADVSSPEDRTQMMGLLSATFGLGFIFGPAIGGLLGGFHIIAPFIGATVITVATLLLTTFVLDESLPPELREKPKSPQAQTTLRQVLVNRNFALILSIGFISTLAFSAIPPTFSLYSDNVLFPDVNEATTIARNVGFMLAFLGMASVVTQSVLLKPLSTRLGERRLVLVGLIIFFFTMLLIPTTVSPIIVTVLLAPFAFSRGVTDPLLQSLVTRFGSPQNQGRMLGLYQSALSLAFIFGPIWSGYVFDNINPKALFRVGALIVIPAAFLAYLLFMGTGDRVAESV
ncbi:MAG: TCR/Tet family MFS transporter [Chloroflexi bacterium]|nr:TCR/Tet family MFS transporter [Chloroflexota bacterium]